MRMYVLCDVDLIPLEQCPSGVFIRFESLGDGGKEKKDTFDVVHSRRVSFSLFLSRIVQYSAQNATSGYV